MSEIEDVEPDVLPEPGKPIWVPPSDGEELLPKWPKDKSLLPTSGKMGSNRQPRALAKGGIEAKRWVSRFVDDPKWDKMIWFWIDNPEMMPAGVFSTLLSYKFGKPAQTVKVKGEILARPYLGSTADEMAQRAQELANRLKALTDPARSARDVTAAQPIEQVVAQVVEEDEDL